jgi:2,3-bisphosphoglycerate-dependent phosphoglycerate mutase
MVRVTTFLFVRHSVTSPGEGDPGLTFEGRLLARTVAEQLRRRHATYVFTSPLRRAYETAEEMALVLGLEKLIDERLRERTNWGDVPGETFDEFLVRWNATDAQLSRARMAAFVQDIGGRYPRATVIVVAHGGIVGDYLGDHEHWPHCGVTEFAA